MNAVATAQKSYEDYVSEWSRIDTTAGWAKGDLLVEMTADARYGDKKMEDLAKDTGTSKSTLFDYRKVAVTFPEKSRRPDISFSVHSLLAALDAADREQILPGLAKHVSYRQAKKDIAAHNRKKTSVRNARITVAKDIITKAVTDAANGITAKDILAILGTKGYITDNPANPDKSVIDAGFISAKDDALIRHHQDDGKYYPPEKINPEIIPGTARVPLTPSKVQEILAKSQEQPEQEAPEWTDSREYHAGESLVTAQQNAKMDVWLTATGDVGAKLIFTRDQWADFITAEYARLEVEAAETGLESRTNHPSAKAKA